MPFDALIAFHNFFRIDWQTLIRVDDHTEQARIGLQEKHKISMVVDPSITMNHFVRIIVIHIDCVLWTNIYTVQG